MRRLLQGSVVDRPLFILVGIASLIGLFAVYDAGYVKAIDDGGGWVWRELLVQIGCLAGGLVLFVAASKARIDTWQRSAKVFWLLMLVLVLAVPIFGVEMNGARQWLGVKGVTIQPSEFAKVGLILYLAGVLATRPAFRPLGRVTDVASWLDNVLVPKAARAVPLLWVSIMLGVVAVEDLGTASVLACIAYGMLLLGGVSVASLVALAALGLGGGLFFVKQQDYRWDRIARHFQRWSDEHVDDTGYQSTQSELAMAIGGSTGVSLGAGRIKHILPAATTDFVLTTLAEEFGFVGAALVIVSLGGVVFRLFILARRAKTPFGALVCGGVGVWIGLQTTVNVLTANGTLPAIGVPLPFVSYGGSSLLALWLAIGLCQSAVRAVPEAAVVTPGVGVPTGRVSVSGSR
ncbi:MAG: FtsW/RodA/SpoVE family cell cycle protein [Fimbriimonadaceae bacterium]|nr:FtsW/RodA/SpoVE family cell cycle protein [Fimbriimonadaceae bacterium]